MDNPKVKYTVSIPYLHSITFDNLAKKGSISKPVLFQKMINLYNRISSEIEYGNKIIIKDPDKNTEKEIILL